MMKTLLLILMPTFATCQIDSLPEIDILFLRIDSFYLDLAAAEQLAFADESKYDWLRFVPSVGLTYTPNGEPRPSVSFSTSIIYQSIQAKQAKVKRNESIKDLNLIAAETAKFELKLLYENYYLKLADLSHFENILEIDRQLFAILQDKFDNERILPDLYLKGKKAYLEREYLMNAKIIELKQLKFEILTKGKFI